MKNQLLKNIAAFGIGLSLLLMGCGSNRDLKQKFKDMEWLLGTWENKTSATHHAEKWQEAGSFTYNGYSFTVDGRDTLYSDHLKIIRDKGEIYFRMLGKEHGNTLPATFKLVEISDNKMVFENKENDYPKRISYERIAPDSLRGLIEGSINNNPHHQEFFLKKTAGAGLK